MFLLVFTFVEKQKNWKHENVSFTQNFYGHVYDFRGSQRDGRKDNQMKIPTDAVISVVIYSLIKNISAII